MPAGTPTFFDINLIASAGRWPKIPAGRRALHITENIIGVPGTPQSVALSGEVLGSGDTPLPRQVIVYRNEDYNTIAGQTVSDAATGAYSLTMPGNNNDKYTVLAIGVPGENSQVYKV